MRFATVLSAAFSLATFALAGTTSAEQEDVPEVIATAAFPDTNPFNHVVNGEKNALIISVENKSDRNVTLMGISAALLQADTNVLLKNLTSLKYGVPLLENVKLQIPYSFFSQFKPGDHRLNVWIEHVTDGTAYKVEAYDSIVTIVDPDFSIFDFKLLSTYAIVAALFGGLLYLAFVSFLPQSKKTRVKKVTPSASASSPTTATATGAGGYDEEWIPEHHLRKSKTAKKQAAVSGTSADELSADNNAAEVKKRKAKK